MSDEVVAGLFIVGICLIVVHFLAPIMIYLHIYQLRQEINAKMQHLIDTVDAIAAALTVDGTASQPPAHTPQPPPQPARPAKAAAATPSPSFWQRLTKSSSSSSGRYSKR